MSLATEFDYENQDVNSFSPTKSIVSLSHPVNDQQPSETAYDITVVSRSVLKPSNSINLLPPKKVSFNKEEFEVRLDDFVNTSDASVIVKSEQGIEENQQQELVDFQDLLPGSEEGDDMSSGKVSSGKRSSVDDFSERIASLTSDIEKILGQNVATAQSPTDPRPNTLSVKSKIRNKRTPNKSYNTTPTREDVPVISNSVCVPETATDVSKMNSSSQQVPQFEFIVDDSNGNDFKAANDIDYSDVNLNSDQLSATIDYGDTLPNNEGNFVRVGTFRKKKTDNRPNVIPRVQQSKANTITKTVKANANSGLGTIHSKSAPGTPEVDIQQQATMTSSATVGAMSNITSQQNSEDAFVSAIEEDFKSSKAFTEELDFLEKIDTGAQVQESSLARQSLYVKFDPYVNTATSEHRKFKPMPPTSENLLLMESPNTSTITEEDPNQTASADVTVTEAPPAVAPNGVDELLSISPQTVQKDQNIDLSPKKDASMNELKLADSITRNEKPVAVVSPSQSPRSKSQMHTNEDNAHVTSTSSYSTEASQVNQQLYLENQRLKKELEDVKQENEELKYVMNEYEKTMSEMIESSEKQKIELCEEMEECCRERDQAISDLNSVETAFSDLHKRYEKMKGFIEGYRQNEDTLKNCIVEYQQKLKKAERRYQTLKTHAEERIESANQEIENVRKSNTTELAGLQAALRREQAKNAGLESSLKQKTQENAELTSICDELIGKIGK